MIRLLWILWRYLPSIVINKIWVKSYLFWIFLESVNTRPIRDSDNLLSCFVSLFYRNLLNFCNTFTILQHFLSVSLRAWTTTEFHPSFSMKSFVSIFYRNLSKMVVWNSNWIPWKHCSLKNLTVQTELLTKAMEELRKLCKWTGLNRFFWDISWECTNTDC